MTVWKWMRVDGAVFHLVTTWKPSTGGDERHDPICGMRGGVVVAVEPTGEMRCLGCLQRVLVDGR